MDEAAELFKKLINDEKFLMTFDEADRKTLKGIAEYGHEVIFVFPAEDDEGVPFAYTTGRSLVGRPELLITGPIHPDRMILLMNIAVKLDDQRKLEPGVKCYELLASQMAVLPIVADPVAAEMNMALRFFPQTQAWQILWPDTEGNLPGEEGYGLADDIQPLYPL